MNKSRNAAGSNLVTMMLLVFVGMIIALFVYSHFTVETAVTNHLAAPIKVVRLEIRDDLGDDDITFLTQEGYRINVSGGAAKQITDIMMRKVNENLHITWQEVRGLNRKGGTEHTERHMTGWSFDHKFFQK